MTDEPTGSCPTCYRRDPMQPIICGPCRSRLRSWLQELPDLFDEVAQIEPVGIAAQKAGGRVSGSKERRLPIAVDQVDLTAPAKAVRLLGEDQIGYDSVASTLDFWVEDWRDARGGREGRPDPDTRSLATWLLRRVDDAMDSHPAIDEMWDDVRRIHGTLQRMCGLTEPRPELCVGIPCRTEDCDLKELYRIPESSYVECAACGRLYTDTDYETWCKELLAATRRKTVVPAA